MTASRSKDTTAVRGRSELVARVDEVNDDELAVSAVEDVEAFLLKDLRYVLHLLEPAFRGEVGSLSLGVG